MWRAAWGLRSGLMRGVRGEDGADRGKKNGQ